MGDVKPAVPPRNPVISINSTESKGGAEKQENDIDKKPILKSSLEVAKFIKQINSKEDCYQEVSSPQSVQISPPTHKPMSQTESRKVFSNDSRKVSPVKSDDSKNLSDIDMAQFLENVEKMSREKERSTGNGRLEMKELENVLKKFQQNPTIATKSADIQEDQSPPPLPLKPRNLSVAKKSTAGIIANPETDSFANEKVSLMGELRSRLNNDESEIDATASEQPKRSFQQPLDPSNPEKIVHKVAYNQYREMLNSYRRNK